MHFNNGWHCQLGVEEFSEGSLLQRLYMTPAAMAIKGTDDKKYSESVRLSTSE